MTATDVPDPASPGVPGPARGEGADLDATAGDIDDGNDATPADDARSDGVGRSGDDSGGDDSGGAEGEASTSARDRRVRSAVEWVAVLAGAVIVALVVRTFLFTTFWIPSGSMEPTLMGSDRKDRVVVNRLSYRFGDVERGDIIVFDVPDGEQTMVVGGEPVEDLIKRVVGLPGETISLRDGQVYVDGAQLNEPYLPPGTRTEPCTEAAEFVIPVDSVFVMGDNRSNSRDARCWSTHWVDESHIVGRAFVRIWPLSELTGL